MARALNTTWRAAPPAFASSSATTTSLGLNVCSPQTRSSEAHFLLDSCSVRSGLLDDTRKGFYTTYSRTRAHGEARWRSVLGTREKGTFFLSDSGLLAAGFWVSRDGAWR
ncbi:hypothetical protein L226DRAFT_541191 [Lentinus tigrinus ALCF2SS1-7]|uniref:uncharacterized protein n=1 Tax=Lentinus tigrinus ALCF2SS1-7 TaxID=1328758 RepID=UPI001165DDB4|nr:hypothetical protein L226DRAFT_541203 [Lentinus tigrinus ALCF2SS1-7]RPD67752.1 hypothetical protein L226DRAFT_541191 [Lentinus tigrinus ALCF2SS1-7]